MRERTPAGAMVSAQARRASAQARRGRLLVVGLLLLTILGLVLLAGGGGGPSAPPAPGLAGPVPAGDPFAYVASAQSAFAARATTGSAQVLFTRSPGGALATAARVAPFRPMIDAAVRGTDIPPALLEGLVFVESAGRPMVIAGTDAADAAGLTQILAQTGASLLGMSIDLPRSRRLTKAINRAELLGENARTVRLETQRARIDARFDPRRELAATVRYLQLARRDLGRLDLAVVAYHAGIGNLQRVLGDYDGGHAVPYSQLFFDTEPDHHAAAWQLLASLGDDSALYLWRILGAEQIMSLYRTDRPALRHLAGLQTAYPSNALVLDPPGAVGSFADPAALSAAYSDRQLVPLPRNPASLHLAYSPGMGALASQLGAPRALYRGLRPAALAMLVEIAALVHRISGAATPLTVASTVLDARYDGKLGFDDPPGTTGYTFQIERSYGSGAQAEAFQFVLDRLQALNLAAWIRGTSTIEITVARDAGRVIAHGI